MILRMYGKAVYFLFYFFCYCFFIPQRWSCEQTNAVFIFINQTIFLKMTFAHVNWDELRYIWRNPTNTHAHRTHICVKQNMKNVKAFVFILSYFSLFSLTIKTIAIPGIAQRKCFIACVLLEA